MFEGSLLAASGPRLQPAKLRLVTGAAAAHAALLVAVAVAQVWTIDPVPPPPETGVLRWVTLPDLGEPAPRRGTPTPPATRRQVAPTEPRQPEAPVQPDRIEPLADLSASSGPETSGDLPVCDGCTPDGSDLGVPFGTGEEPEGGSATDAVVTWTPGSGILPPVVVHRVQPEYPRSAIVVHRSGTAVVVATIDRSGLVRDARILKDPGFGLGPAALAAVRQWRFQPATRDGNPVSVRYQLTVTFTLR